MNSLSRYSEDQTKTKKNWGDHEGGIYVDLYRAPTQVCYHLNKTARMGKTTLSDAPPPGTYAEVRDVFTQYPAYRDLKKKPHKKH